MNKITQNQLIDTLKNSQLPWIVRKNKDGEVLAAFDMHCAALSYLEVGNTAKYASIYDSVNNKWMGK